MGVAMNLEYKSLEELIQIKEEAEKLIVIKEREAKKDLLNQFKEQAAALGLTLEDVVGNAPRTTRRRGTVPPKYRNPHNAEQTWTGRGKQPIWVRELLSQGRTLESFEI